jgi:hypothetical protein
MAGIEARAPSPARVRPVPIAVSDWPVREWTNSIVRGT